MYGVRRYNLQNCTWHRDNSCCVQQDVMAAFQDLRGVGLDLDTPPGGMCREVMTYVMCHFCAYVSSVRKEFTRAASSL